MNIFTVREHPNTRLWEVSSSQHRLGPGAMQDVLEYHFSSTLDPCRFIVRTQAHNGYEYLHIDAIAYLNREHSRRICEYYAGFYTVIGVAVTDEYSAQKYRDILEQRITWQILKEADSEGQDYSNYEYL